MKWTKERKQKHSLLMKGNSYSLGRKRSFLTCLRMSISRKGNKNTLGHKTTLTTRSKQSQSHKRRWLLNPDARRNMSLRQIGKDNANWQGGKSFEPYNSEFNKELKELIRLRDGYSCQLCNIPECELMTKLYIHHIDYNKENCLATNLVSLCNNCNSKVNFGREYWIEHFRQHLNLMQVNPKALKFKRDVKQKTKLTGISVTR